jgi:hypothetical protein
MTEYLAAHADQLIGLRAPAGWGSPRNQQVRDLTTLAEQLHAVLRPVTVDGTFRRRLHGDLVLEAQRHQAEPVTGLLHQHRKGILIGAAAVGSIASVVGVFVAFLLRWRHDRAPHSAC